VRAYALTDRRPEAGGQVAWLDACVPQWQGHPTERLAVEPRQHHDVAVWSRTLGSARLDRAQWLTQIDRPDGGRAEVG
jgi:hypothetical protein